MDPPMESRTKKKGSGRGVVVGWQQGMEEVGRRGGSVEGKREGKKNPICATSSS